AQRRHRRAAEIVEAAWTRAPHPALARAYGALRKSDTKAKRAERLRALAALNPDHRESRILLAETALDQSNRDAARQALANLTAQPPVSARVCVMAARAAQLDADAAAAQRWMTRAAHAPGEADWSDIDETGAAFPFTDADWKRMVDAWGREERLIHPRHERFEIAAAAAPDTALLEGPQDAGAAKPGDTAAPDSYQAPRAPDDPGVEDDARKD
ncbi:MAG: heme biosynthesis protein HemY, partial [Oceanicaulis sp.]|nr:heme biosynthesis protein HemY [Oceanicaulis sp.]